MSVDWLIGALVCANCFMLGWLVEAKAHIASLKRSREFLEKHDEEWLNLFEALVDRVELADAKPTPSNPQAAA